MSTRRIAEGKQQITAIMPCDLVAAIDRAAKREVMDRTAWLIQAAIGHLPNDIGQEFEHARMRAA